MKNVIFAPAGPLNTAFFSLGMSVPTLTFYFITLGGGPLVAFLYGWQQLIGSIIGAAVPFSLYLLNEKREARIKQRSYMILLEKNLVSALNDLISIDGFLDNFLTNTLRDLRKSVTEAEKHGQYFVGQAFLPLSSALRFDSDLLRSTTESSYIDYQVLDIIQASRNMSDSLVELRHQFESTMRDNIQQGLTKLNTSTIHNKTLMDNLTAFELMMRDQTIQRNIPFYVRKLAGARVALRTLGEWGLAGWKAKFNFPPSEEGFRKMDAYFKSDIDAEISNLQPDFRARLLKTGEEAMQK